MTLRKIQNSNSINKYQSTEQRLTEVQIEREREREKTRHHTIVKATVNVLRRRVVVRSCYDVAESSLTDGGLRGRFLR